MRSPTRFKICCMASVAEAALAIRYGASAVGLVSAMPSGPGPIPEALIAEIAATIPPGVSSFLLTSLQTAEEIIAQHWRCGTDTIQIVDALLEGTHAEIRRALPGIRIVQVIHVNGEESVREALSVAPSVDALLLDSGKPQAAVKELGGTGRTHDWSLSRRIVEDSPVPVWLAGGLNPDNAAEAIRQVHPFGLDICSGLRTDGHLDENKVARFVAAIRQA